MADKKKFILRKKDELSKKAKKVSMPMKDFVKEHKELVRVLRSPSHKDDLKEAKDQQKELDEKTKKSETDVGNRDPKSKQLADFIIRHNQKKLHKAEDDSPGSSGTFDFHNAVVAVDAGLQVGAENSTSQDLLAYLKANMTSEISKIKLPKGLLTLSVRDVGLYNGFFQDLDGQVVEKFDAQTLEIIAKNLELKNWYEAPPAPAKQEDAEEDREIARDEARQVTHEALQVHNALYHKDQAPGEPKVGKKGTQLKIKFGDLEIELRKSVRDFVHQFKTGSSDERVVQKSITAWRKRMANVMPTNSDHSAARELLSNWEVHKEDFSQMVFAIKKLGYGDHED